MSHNSRESNRFFAPICDFDPQLPPNGGREGGNDMIKYFGYKYLVNRPLIIEIYENALGYFYCMLHTVCVKDYNCSTAKVLDLSSILQYKEVVLIKWPQLDELK